MICEAEDIMRAKDNAQSALAIKSLIGMSEFREYFKQQFFSTGIENEMSNS